MSKSARLIIGFLLLFVAYFGESAWEQLKNIDIKPAPSPEEVVVINITPPSEADKNLTKKIQQFTIAQSDAKAISDFYGQLAEVIRDDNIDKIILQNKPFREWYIKSGSLNFNPEIKGKYIGLGEAVDNVFILTLGTEDIKWTPAMRERAAQVCDAVAWAVHQ